MKIKQKQHAVVLDIDDTIVDYVSFVCELYNKINGTIICERDIVDWDMNVAGLPDNALRDLFIRFEKHGLYASLPLLPQAYNALMFMRSLGYKLIYVTARPESAGEETYLYFLTNDLPFDKIIYSSDKVKTLRELSKDYHIALFADDKLETVVKVNEKCRIDTVCLVNRTSNEGIDIDPNIIRVNGIFDTLRYLPRI